MQGFEMKKVIGRSLPNGQRSTLHATSGSLYQRGKRIKHLPSRASNSSPEYITDIIGACLEAGQKYCSNQTPKKIEDIIVQNLS